jgi:cystathionine beta-synthase
VWKTCCNLLPLFLIVAFFTLYLYSSGIAKKLKEHNPNIIIVGVDPEGSLLAQPERLNDSHRLEPYHVEGIGYDFIPKVLDRSLIDEWYKSNDNESLVMMRRLIRDEGLLCGGSSGSAVACALKAAATLKKGQRCVIILPDSVRNYMTKALSDDWMLDNGFVDNDIIKAKRYESWWATKRVCDLPINTPLTITSDVTCADAIYLLKQEGYDMVPVLADGAVIGVVTEGNMTNRLLAGRAMPDDTVQDAGVIYKTFHKFTMDDTLATLAHALDHDPYALIVTEQRCFSGGASKKLKLDLAEPKNASDMGEDDSIATTGSNVVIPDKKNVATKSVVSGIVTRIDLLDFVSKGEQKMRQTA